MFQVDVTAFVRAQRAAGANAIMFALNSLTYTSAAAVSNSAEGASGRPQLVSGRRRRSGESLAAKVPLLDGSKRIDHSQTCTHERLHVLNRSHWFRCDGEEDHRSWRRSRIAEIHSFQRLLARRLPRYRSEHVRYFSAGSEREVISVTSLTERQLPRGAHFLTERRNAG
jgi:hypothetical protein